MGGFRKLHSKELHNLHHSRNIIRLIKRKRGNFTGLLA
jgi:hypothetical protein